MLSSYTFWTCSEIIFARLFCCMNPRGHCTELCLPLCGQNMQDALNTVINYSSWNIMGMKSCTGKIQDSPVSGLVHSEEIELGD